MILKFLKQRRAQKLRKFCIEQAVRAGESIGIAAKFEYYIKNGAHDISALVDYEKKIDLRQVTSK